jgi:rhodanese-related sulfurtransferase
MFRSLFGYTNEAAPVSTDIAGVKQLDASGLHERLENGERIFLLDVRSAQEYAYDGHIAGSHLMPLPMLMSRAQELPHDMPIVCVCRSGNRSQTAAEQLLRLGYSDVANLAGGMRGWRALALPYD